MCLVTDAAASGYQDLYDDTHGLLESMAGFWTVRHPVIA